MSTGVVLTRFLRRGTRQIDKYVGRARNIVENAMRDYVYGTPLDPVFSTILYYDPILANIQTILVAGEPTSLECLREVL